MKVKFNFGFWDFVNFLISCIIAMQVGVISGRSVIYMLEGSGAPALAILLTALFAIFASVVLTCKSLFMFDKWLDKWLDKFLDGKKWRFKYLNVGHGRSIWLVDLNSFHGSSILGYRGIGIGFYTDGDVCERLTYHHKRRTYVTNRFWRFGLEWTKQH